MNILLTYSHHFRFTSSGGILKAKALRTYPEYFLCKSSLKKAKLMN